MNATTRTCTVEGCDRKYLASGYCQLHYSRMRQTGTTELRRGPSVEERFWASVQKTSTCWLWTGRKQDSYGHGRFNLNGRNLPAHRVAWQMLRGPIKDGLVLDHLCRITNCVNPEHLEAVTSGENVLRGIGPGAINKRKTHCKRGHEFTLENTRLVKGGRSCKICERNKLARQRAEGKRSGGKYYRDGKPIAGLLADDDHTRVLGPDHRAGAPGTPRIVLTIEEVK